ncbi:DUF309 domain-containing protein [Paenibacillus sp. BC26]|uniref:DUF309 domain-containing protein n=1 Tax=Paenibacillus sp. BC26 TaxID=1881032 RepID=UPI0008E51511|nr:DUF309 domain-containing protein [Paenibacillus sp. BC26]SFS61894.1 hypothetical protein SAMN05428962_1551 [Paenibacillus sp. BC26]
MQLKQYPAAYESFLYEFHATRDYFECHELLEEYWKAQPGDLLGSIWVGLIQIAVGSYHHRRHNNRGALKILRQAEKRLDAQLLNEVGLNGEQLIAMIAERIEAIEDSLPFTDMNLPIVDSELHARSVVAAEREGYVWGAPSRMDEALISRHTLRDRSDVIAARAAAAKEKKR